MLFLLDGKGKNAINRNTFETVKIQLQHIRKRAPAAFHIVQVEPRLPAQFQISGHSRNAEIIRQGDVVIPESVLFIGNYAFANSKINSITIADATVVYNNAFEGWTAEQTINTPKTAYQAASTWNLDWYKNSNATIVWKYEAE